MAPDPAQLRDELVDWLRRHGACRSPAVEQAMREVERHRFVPEVDVRVAYANEAIVTKWGDGGALSSISQPAIVVEMLDMLDAGPGDAVLEVGAGTGYNAALLSRIVGPTGRVFTVEVDPEMADRAARALAGNGYGDVAVQVGDGREGWPAGAPYTGIIVTAGAEGVARAWVDQLADGGRLVVPVTPEHRAVLFVKRDGRLVEQRSVPAGFLALR